MKKAILRNDLIRYTVPQVVDFDNLTHNFDISFRSKTKATLAIFRLKQDGVVIKEKRARHVVPAEMEKFNVELEDLISTNGLEIEMEIVQ